MKAMDLSHGERNTLLRSTEKNGPKFLSTAVGGKAYIQYCSTNESCWRRAG